ncbi:MAG: winged helix-turn-helix transcriptional regulator [Acidobacteria bacterium]|nr:winged helix-turn-helix transcriptional regulator [Acidobacteriota bacterium]
MLDYEWLRAGAMIDPLPSPRVLRFDAFELDAQTRELRKNGASVKLQKQPADLLAILVERAGRVVTREELQERLWPGKTFGDFDIGLNKAVQTARDSGGFRTEPPVHRDSSAAWIPLCCARLNRISPINDAGRLCMRSLRLAGWLCFSCRLILARASTGLSHPDRSRLSPYCRSRISPEIRDRSILPMASRIP